MWCIRPGPEIRRPRLSSFRRLSARTEVPQDGPDALLTVFTSHAGVVVRCVLDKRIGTASSFGHVGFVLVVESLGASSPHLTLSPVLHKSKGFVSRQEAFHAKMYSDFTCPA